MINTGEFEEQKTGGGGPIPEGSVVRMSFRINTPKNPDPNRAFLHVSPSGNVCINGEFEVTHGTYQGRKIWQYLVVEGSQQASAIAKRTIRAIVESARGINTDDKNNPNRNLNDWTDLHGMECVVKVGVEKEANDKGYFNNRIMRIITPGDENYQAVINGGEVISDAAVPQKAPAQTGGGMPEPAPTTPATPSWP